jgi:polyketide cyclase/dehydrase/lipid transport protein
MQIEVAKTVAARPTSVFATIADIANWPMFVRSVRAIELLTPRPIRVGTRLRQTRIMMGHEATDELEVMTIERPRRLRLVGETRGMHYEVDHLVDALAVGSRLVMIFRNRPETQTARGLRDFIAPFMEIRLRDDLEEDLNDFAAAAVARASARKPG